MQLMVTQMGSFQESFYSFSFLIRDGGGGNETFEGRKKIMKISALCILCLKLDIASLDLACDMLHPFRRN